MSLPTEWKKNPRETPRLWHINQIKMSGRNETPHFGIHLEATGNNRHNQDTARESGRRAGESPPVPKEPSAPRDRAAPVGEHRRVSRLEGLEERGGSPPSPHPEPGELPQTGPPPVPGTRQRPAPCEPGRPHGPAPAATRACCRAAPCPGRGRRRAEGTGEHRTGRETRPGGRWGGTRR